MARRRVNMLEAFKASRDQTLQADREALHPEPATVRERLQRSLARVGVGEAGPDSQSGAGNAASLAETGSNVASPIGSSSQGGAPPGVSTGSSRGAAMPSQPRPLVDTSTPSEGPARLTLSPWVLVGYSLTLAGLSFVLGWQIGERRANDSAQSQAQASFVSNGSQELPNPAALPNQLGGELSESGAAPSESPPSIADRAFENPANHHTLVAESFNHHRQGRERAIAHYHYLKDQGFPVIKPRLKGDVIYLLVGAAPDEASLEGLLGELKNLQYPGSQGRTFSSAYGSPIDHVF